MKRAFVSHISEEATIAIKLKEVLNKDFLNMLDVFVSSDEESIAAGEEWLTSIRKAINNAAIVMTLCSPTSLTRPWINFEVGAAWIQEREIIPLCHAGITPRDLRMPLSLRHGVTLSNPQDLRRLYRRIAGTIECAIPNPSFEELANEFAQLSTLVEAKSQAELGKISKDRAIGKRLGEALNHPRFKWRSLEWLAIETGISEEVAADLLRANDEIRFSKARSGKVIVGLRSRVG